MEKEDNDAEFFAFKDYDKTELSKIKNVKGRVQDYYKNINKFGKIDGARFVDFNQLTRNITIRVDDSNVPGFWLEINLSLDQMEKWLETKET